MHKIAAEIEKLNANAYICNRLRAADCGYANDM